MWIIQFLDLLEGEGLAFAFGSGGRDHGSTLRQYLANEQRARQFGRVRQIRKRQRQHWRAKLKSRGRRST